MSGSGGGGWDREPKDDCATLTEFTTLNSPNQAVLKKLKKRRCSTNQCEESWEGLIVEALYGAEVAGTITSSIIQRLAECIEKGFRYGPRSRMRSKVARARSTFM